MQNLHQEILIEKERKIEFTPSGFHLNISSKQARAQWFKTGDEALWGELLPSLRENHWLMKYHKIKQF